jgi:hypothetical protein
VELKIAGNGHKLRELSKNENQSAPILFFLFFIPARVILGGLYIEKRSDKKQNTQKSECYCGDRVKLDKYFCNWAGDDRPHLPVTYLLRTPKP